MVTAIDDLIEISHFAGNRFDLVQAGGGNSSIKTGDSTMLIKSSGISLSEVESDSGYVAVDYHEIRQFLNEQDFSQYDKTQRELLANQVMDKSRIENEGKPSIETFLHALLNSHTLHTHPISVNILAAKENWKSLLLDIWPEAVCVPYFTPGIDLAIAMVTEVKLFESNHHQLPKVVFLQNHGLIISAENSRQVKELTEQVCLKIESEIGIDLQRYHQASKLKDLLAQLPYPNIQVLCNDDMTIHNYFDDEQPNIATWPFCPDTLVYCGIRPVFMDSIQDTSDIEFYISSYQDHPKVIVLNNTIYFCAQSQRKARDAQDLLKFHLMVIHHSDDSLQRLSMDEIAYLSNWDAEKYRQGV